MTECTSPLFSAPSEHIYGMYTSSALHWQTFVQPQLNINFITRPPILRSEQNAYLGKVCELELLIGRSSKVAFADIIFSESAAENFQGRMFTAVVKQHQTSSGNLFRNELGLLHNSVDSMVNSLPFMSFHFPFSSLLRLRHETVKRLRAT